MVNVMSEATNKNATYECFGVIAQGTVSTIYDGYDHLLKRDVVIKELREELRSDAEIVAAFWAEATVMAGLNHGSILRIYGIEHDRYWVIMEPMSGPLAHEVGSTKVDAPRVREILKQALEGLHYLHNQGRVHGQVRLDSLLVDHQGNVKLTNISDVPIDSEFGEFRSPDDKQLHNAPEILNPRHFGEPTFNTDLYGLGIVALQLLAGEKFIKFFKGMNRKRQSDPFAWSAWHASSEAVAAVASLLPDVPADLATLVEGLTQKQVGLRFATAAEAIGVISPSSFADSTGIGLADAGLPAEKHSEEGDAVTYNSPNLFMPRKASIEKRPADWRAIVNEFMGQFPILRNRKLVFTAATLFVLCIALMVNLSTAEQKQDIAVNDDQAGSTDETSTDVALPALAHQATPVVFAEIGTIRLNLIPAPKGPPLEGDFKLFVNDYEIAAPALHEEDTVEAEGPTEGRHTYNRTTDDSFTLAHSRPGEPLIVTGPIGACKVEVRAKHYKVCKQEVTVVADTISNCELTLEPEVYTVLFNVQPPSAKLFIDGKPWSVQDSSLRPVPIAWGKHILRATADDHQVKEWTLVVDRNRDEPVSLAVIPEFSISIDSFPQGALVEIDGKPIGRTPAYWKGRQGKHQVKLGLQGFVTVVNQFTLDENSTRLLWYLDRPGDLLASDGKSD